jgi:hypothetical protein
MESFFSGTRTTPEELLIKNVLSKMSESSKKNVLKAFFKEALADDALLSELTLDEKFLVLSQFEKYIHSEIKE